MPGIWVEHDFAQLSLERSETYWPVGAVAGDVRGGFDVRSGKL